MKNERSATSLNKPDLERLEGITTAPDLESLNESITSAMANQRIQALIKDEQLQIINKKVIDLALSFSADSLERLLAAATLGRLSAVAKKREDIALNGLENVITEDADNLEILRDSDQKYYAALAISSIDSDWKINYLISQIYTIENAEKARARIITDFLDLTGSLEEFFRRNAEHCKVLRKVESPEARYRRIQRITEETLKATLVWQGSVGEQAGSALADWLYELLLTSKNNVKQTVLVNIIDNILGCLLRLIEIRFSFAFQSSTYEVVGKIRTVLHEFDWSTFTRQLNRLERVRFSLKEAALVVARQGKTDSELAERLISAYYSRSQAVAAIKSHFSGAADIVDATRNWWENLGNVRQHQDFNQPMGNSEDQQIGSLIIHLERSTDVWERIERAALPFLELTDPPTAATVQQATASYNEIKRSVEFLARIRHLRLSGIEGHEIEYNPLHHEMIGGHQQGVRFVYVERDGIKKTLNGRERILVKARVRPSNKKGN